MIARLFDGLPRRTLVLMVLLLALALLAPLFAGDYLLTVLILIFYFAYIGQAWNIMMGFAGQLSLGHALYVGLGAYTAAALYVHFGIGPWIGLLVAVPIAGARRRLHRLSRVSFPGGRRLFRHPHHCGGGIRPRRLRPSELDQRIVRSVPAGQAICPQRSVAPARPSGNVLLRAAGRHGARPYRLPPAAAKPHRLFLAGDPRGRGGRTLGRHRHLPLQDGGGGDLRRHDRLRRRGLCVLLQQPVSRAGVQYRPARSRSSWGRSWAASARCSAPSSAPSCSPASPRRSPGRWPPRASTCRGPSRCSTASACCW